MNAMPEPLRGKIEFPHWVNPCFRVKDVQSAVEFYRKYFDLPSSLLGDKPELKRKLKPFFNEDMTKVNIERKYEYNLWLLDYCFGDVIE